MDTLDYFERHPEVFEILKAAIGCRNQCERVYVYDGDPHNDKAIEEVRAKRLDCSTKCNHKYPLPPGIPGMEEEIQRQRQRAIKP